MKTREHEIRPANPHKSMGAEFDHDGSTVESDRNRLRFCDACGDDMPANDRRGQNDASAICPPCRRAGYRSIEDYAKSAA